MHRVHRRIVFVAIGMRRGNGGGGAAAATLSVTAAAVATTAATSPLLSSTKGESKNTVDDCGSVAADESLPIPSVFSPAASPLAAEIGDGGVTHAASATAGKEEAIRQSGELAASSVAVVVVAATAWRSSTSSAVVVDIATKSSAAPRWCRDIFDVCSSVSVAVNLGSLIIIIGDGGGGASDTRGVVS